MAIEIYDKNNNLIGELMNASVETINKYISKGFIVVDKATKKPIMDTTNNETIGVSDGLIPC